MNVEFRRTAKCSAGFALGMAACTAYCEQPDAPANAVSTQDAHARNAKIKLPICEDSLYLDDSNFFAMPLLRWFICIAALAAFRLSFCAQKNPRIEKVNLTYAADYAPPGKIAFVFTGSLNYVAYYFEYLEPAWKKTFGAKNKNVSSHYLDKITEEALSTADAVFVLNVNGAETINERSGHDRTVKHTLQGSLRCKKTGVTLLSFLDVVYTVHDIAAFSKGVAKKLHERLERTL